MRCRRAGILYIIVNQGLYHSRDIGATWKLLTIDSTGNIWNFISDANGNIFAYLPDNIPSPSGMYRSTDEGETWTFFNKGLTCTRVNSIIELSNGAIAAATDSGIFTLPLEGCEWQPYSSGLWTKNVLSIGCSKSGQLYAGSDGCGVFKSTKLFNDTLNFTGAIDPGGPVDYKTIQTGTTSCRNITLKNRGVKPLTIQSYTVVDPTPFSLSDESAKKFPITLNPNDSVVMTICFHPPQPAVYASSIIWNTDIDPSLCGIRRETELHGVATQNSDVKNPPNKINFSIRPNPVSGNSITITFPEASGKNRILAIYDVLGREMYNAEISDGVSEYEAPVGNLSEGIYYSRLSSGTVVLSEKFVKMSDH